MVRMRVSLWYIKTTLMKTIKNITLILILIIGIFSFKNPESNSKIVSLNEIAVKEILSKESAGNRPSTEFMFYVETEVVQKNRGYSIIDASIYIFERSSGKFKILANNNVVVPYHKEAVLEYEVRIVDYDKTLENGDKIIINEGNSTYNFSDLMENHNIYRSYVDARNKLLKENLK